MFYFNRTFQSTLTLIYNCSLFGFGIFLFFTLIFNNPNDPSLNVAAGYKPSNIFGFVGSYFSDFFFQNFGIVSYFISILIFLRVIFFFREIKKFSLIGLVLIFFALVVCSAIFSNFQTSQSFPYPSYGGFLGMLVNSIFLSFSKNYYIFLEFIVLFLLVFFILFNDFEEFRNFLKDKINAIKKKINFFKLSKKFSYVNSRKPVINSVNNVFENRIADQDSQYINNSQYNNNNSLTQSKGFDFIKKFQSLKSFIKERFSKKSQNKFHKNIHIDHYTKPNIYNSFEKTNNQNLLFNKNYNLIKKDENLDLIKKNENLDLIKRDENSDLIVNDDFSTSSKLFGNNENQNSVYQSDFFKNNGKLIQNNLDHSKIEPENSDNFLQKNEKTMFSAPQIKQYSKEINLIEKKIYQSPDLSLLQDKQGQKEKINHEFVKELSEKLIKVLEDFSIFGKIVDYFVGPVITLFEFEPLPGTKSSRVIGLSDDIARSLSAISARISVISGKNAIGIELPNTKREIVLLKELLVTEEYQNNSMILPIALGKNIAGIPIIVDLAKMPHVLVAGTTGSGKSVAINVFILSLLYKMKPDECRFIMIDPKMLELSVYNGIPHLLTPVVTDPKKAVLVLKWVVKEMENRYKMMSYIGVRNIQNFNQKIEESIASGAELFKIINLGFDKGKGENITEKIIIEKKKFHYIVVIVDEMADLMLVAGKEIEFYIQRIAQMARAAGIHIIMATQRPSVDVITGVIKANLPTRISFAVTNKIDSRTILGEQGAEQLLGMGDMLYMPSGGKIIRVHGPFVSDKTVENVVNFLQSTSGPQYIAEIMEEIESVLTNSSKNNYLDDDFDENSQDDKDEMLYKQALKIVFNEKKTSISYIQRQLRIGYNKSANLIERMEKEGILSPPNHQGKRDILKEIDFEEKE